MSLAATPSSPSSVGSRDEYGRDEPSSPSWAGDAASGAEDSDAALSSDDGNEALELSQASVRPKIKFKRDLAALDEGTDTDAPASTSRATPSVSPAPGTPSISGTGEKRKRPIKQLRAKPLRAALESLLAAFKKRDPYQFFHEPVNADEVPGYREVITHPMDLGTMEKRLAEQYYTSMDAFRHDFLLITQNAQTFNPPTSIYHTAARRLETWGVRAIEREGLSVVDDDAFVAEAPPRPPPTASRRGRRRTMDRTRRDTSAGAAGNDELGPGSPYTSESGGRRTVRIGSARSTPWSATPPAGVPDTYETRLFRRTLAYAGVSPHTLTGKSACAARMQEKPKVRLGPIPSFLAEPNGAQSQGEASDEALPVQNYTYMDDGSLDPARLANTYEYMAQALGPATLVCPRIESLRHLPMSLAMPNASNPQAEASFVFPSVQPGRPDPLSAATLAQPGPSEENWSHTFQGTSVPSKDRLLPFAVAGAPPPPGLAQGTAAPNEARGLHPVWPVAPPPPIQDPLQSGLRLNRRERELEQERDEQNWTFFRPHLQRLLGAADVGLYTNLPAWAASTTDGRALRPFAQVAGTHLTDALREHLRAMPYSALGLPRTAQYVPRTSLRQLPAALQISMQGAQEAERLLEVVYGGVQGMAFVRSIAEFVGGAAASCAPDVPVRAGKSEPGASPAPVIKREASVEGDTLPKSDDGAMAVPSPCADTLPTSLVEYVKTDLVRPLTGGLLELLERVGEHLAQVDVGPTPASPHDEPLYTLLDDPEGAVSTALWRALHPDAAAPAPRLNEVLARVLPST